MSATATQELGNHIGELLFPGSVVLLHGELGAGKTAFTQGIGRGLGISEPVTSPTFTIVQEYHSGRIPLIHADLYRVGDAAELYDIGFDEYFECGGVVVVEWPERLGDLRPAGYLSLNLEHTGSDARRITLEGVGAPHEDIVEKVVKGGPLAVESTCL